ncbi:hypothetical protein BH10PSE19_BH10PSE19_00780 [soil metagenome]
MSNVLSIPMQIDAWVVNNAVLQPSPDHPEQVIRRWTLDYSQLNNFMSPMPDPFSAETNTAAVGIYLHWTLPVGLRHAIQDDANNSTMQFPYVPNRWLVIRYYGPIEKRIAMAWVIESDYMADATIATSPYPAGKVGQTKIGRCIPLAGWQENAATKELFLTAVSSGDIHFSTFQPYNENVFSLHDNLGDIPQAQINTQQLSYFVAGWYANATQDPLANCDTVLKYEDLLHRYKWQVDNSETIANQLVCHGMIHSINWDNTANASVPASPQNALNLTDIKVAVGSSSIEALSALVINSNPDLIPKLLLDAFSLGLLDKLDATDGVETIAETMQQRGFNTQSGGTHWVIVPQNSQNSDAASSALGLTADEAKQLDNLNSLQTQLDIQQQILSKIQWDLYALWWKQGNAANAYITPPLSTTQNTLLTQQLSATVADSLFNKVKIQQQHVSELATQFNTAYTAFNTQLATKQKILKVVNRGVFWQPKDPVVLITGIQSPWLQQLQNNLPCRYLNESINTLYLTADKTKFINQQAIQAYMPQLNTSAIPIAVQSLLTEFFLLDPLNAASLQPLATAAGMTLDSLTAIINAHSQDSFNGILPYYGLDAWTQAWLPYFLEWEVIWYPIPFENWVFDGERYHLNTLPAAIQQQTLNSRDLLNPQASFAFKGQLKRLIDQDPTFQKAFPDWQNLIAAIDQWPIMTVTLGSFQSQLVQRDHRINRIPNVNDNNENAIAALIADQAQYTPLPGPAAADPFSPPPSTFQATRQGQFYFNRLSIVDRFGQAVNAIQSDTAKNIIPIVSEMLMLDSNVTTKQLLAVDALSPLRFIQLTPRVIQPLRLDIDWLLANDNSNSKRLLNNCQINPIAGWILPNYLDQALQIYDPQGKGLGELSLVENNDGTFSCSWNAAFQSPYATVEDMQTDYPWLSNMLQTFVAKDVTKRIIDPVSAYNALLELIDQAFATQNSNYLSANQYLAAFIGRPLSLARIRCQLQLQQPAYTDQSWAKTLAATATYTNYNFPMQLGNTNLNQDGLIGYFQDENFQKFYSLYGSQSKNNFTQATVDQRFSLQPLDPNIDTPKIITVLRDPFAKLNAHSDILPLQSLQLPSVFIKAALNQMQVTFRQGSLLTTRGLTTDALQSVTLLKPTVKGKWSWLEPTLDGKQQEIMLQNADSTARFTGKTNELVEGQLKLCSAFDDDAG